MLKEFKEFALKGNMIDLAIGVIIGGAFNSLVTSLVENIIMPILSLVTGKIDFSNLFIALDGNTYKTLAAAQAAGASTVNYGLFITGLLNFLIMAFVIFMIVKTMNKLRTKTEKPVEETVKPVRHQETKKEQPKPREEKKIIKRSEEEIAEIKAEAEMFLSGVFKAMELEVELKIEYTAEDGSLEVEFIGQDMGILIGKRGQTLDSLQYLTSLVVNKGRQGYVRVKLDTEDYRNRRKETLENLAKSIAYKVRKTRKPVSLEPMNPYERRIIHSALQGNRYVETYSEGSEPYRHVVVKLKK